MTETIVPVFLFAGMRSMCNHGRSSLCAGAFTFQTMSCLIIRTEYWFYIVLSKKPSDFGCRCLCNSKDAMVDDPDGSLVLHSPLEQGTNSTSTYRSPQHPPRHRKALEPLQGGSGNSNDDRGNNGNGNGNGGNNGGGFSTPRRGRLGDSTPGWADQHPQEACMLEPGDSATPGRQTRGWGRLRCGRERLFQPFTEWHTSANGTSLFPSKPLKGTAGTAGTTDAASTARAARSAYTS